MIPILPNITIQDYDKLTTAIYYEKKWDYKAIPYLRFR